MSLWSECRMTHHERGRAAAEGVWQAEPRHGQRCAQQAANQSMRRALARVSEAVEEA
jgi:hypothetical protein